MRGCRAALTLDDDGSQAARATVRPHEYSSVSASWFDDSI
jgi:hypothetical protein